MIRSSALAAIRAVCLFIAVYATGEASASVLANKAFSPTTVALGVTSTVTVTLSNTSLSQAAVITSFSDDVSTMSGYAKIAPSPGLATTCTGGSVTVSGQVVTLTGGTIAMAADSTHPGTCTVTFNVIGAAAGNGINTIPIGALVTSLGSNSTAASQTLQVQSATLSVAGSSSTTVGTSATTQQTYTITNPTVAQLTNTTFAITLTGSSNESFSVTSGTTTCGGSVSLTGFPAAGGTATAAGLTIPASGSCTVTLTVTDPAANLVTVSGALAVGAISDDQGLTSNKSVTDRSSFVSTEPQISMSFSPNTVIPGGTSTLSISIVNNQTTAMTGVAISDTLPANMTLDPNPATTQTGCGSGGSVGGAGTGTLSYSGGSIAAAATLGSGNAASTCTITVTVDTAASATGTLTNTIAAAGLTDTQGFTAQSSASASLTISSTDFTVSQSIGAGSVARNTPTQVSLQFTNLTSAPLTAGSFTDDLPQSPVSMLFYSGFTPTLSGGCTGGTVTANGANTVVSGTGIGVAASSTCTVTFEVYLTVGGLPKQTDTNATGTVSFTTSGSQLVTSTGASATLSTSPTFSITNPQSSGSNLANQPVTLTAQLTDQAASGVADTNVVATINLNSTASPHQLWLAASPNVTISGGSTCSNLTASAAPQGESITITGATLSSSCTITYNVVNEGSVSGASVSYTPGSSTYTSTENNGTSTFSAGHTAKFYTTSLLVNNVFAPNSVSSGATATAKITLDVAAVSSLSTTQANGVTFSDTLPTYMLFAAVPNITFSAGCQQSGQAAPSYAINGSTIAFSNISLVTVGSTQTDCNVTFDVTSYALENETNALAAGAVTSTSGATNAQGASASLSIVAGVALQKTFLTNPFAIGGTNFVRFVIVNSSIDAVGSGTLTDSMPSSLALASLTAQPSAQSGDPADCGGTVGGTVGSSTFTLSGMSVAAATSSTTPGLCVRYVQVTASSSGAPGAVVNTMPIHSMTVGGLSNETAASASLTIGAAPNVAVSEAFTPASIVPNGTSQLVITIGNTASGAAALSSLALSDALPSGVKVASPAGASTTCASASLAATAGATTVALSGGTLAANGSCTITVSVTSAAAAAYTDAIAAGALTTTQGSTNAAVSASLAVSSTATPAPSPSPLLTLNLTASTTTPASGTQVTYSEDFKNAGNVAITLNTITIPIPAGTCFLLGSAASPSLPSGLNATITYVKSGGGAYTPQSGPCGTVQAGYDSAVTGVLWTFGSTLAAGAGGTIQLTTLVP